MTAPVAEEGIFLCLQVIHSTLLPWTSEGGHPGEQSHYGTQGAIGLTLAQPPSGYWEL